ncbi:Mediator of DNA damage checkpoint protein 1 [Dimargaris verticillata]|uniref:Mediator of DNA damage checkpoint protein 1 n=1 Tax=Dimargaris verticillata TaxID=2761393 RepID=A0A9W8B9H1_9FUNG|nr:Mediator of DNA damage checkpoint protein 1 [Dimargaris verticillata]
MASCHSNLGRAQSLTDRSPRSHRTGALPLSSISASFSTPVAYLRQLASSGEPERLFPLFAGSNVLGSKDIDAHVVLSHTSVSDRHARIEISQGEHFIEDLHSFFGVRLGAGRMLARRSPRMYQLLHNYPVQIGAVRLIYEIPPGPNAWPPVPEYQPHHHRASVPTSPADSALAGAPRLYRSTSCRTAPLTTGIWRSPSPVRRSPGITTDQTIAQTKPQLGLSHSSPYLEAQPNSLQGSAAGMAEGDGQLVRPLAGLLIDEPDLDPTQVMTTPQSQRLLSRAGLTTYEASPILFAPISKAPVPTTRSHTTPTKPSPFPHRLGLPYFPDSQDTTQGLEPTQPIGALIPRSQNASPFRAHRQMLDLGLHVSDDSDATECLSPRTSPVPFSALQHYPRSDNQPWSPTQPTQAFALTPTQPIPTSYPSDSLPPTQLSDATSTQDTSAPTQLITPHTPTHTAEMRPKDGGCTPTQPTSSAEDRAILGRMFEQEVPITTTPRKSGGRLFTKTQSSPVPKADHVRRVLRYHTAKPSSPDAKVRNPTALPSPSHCPTTKLWASPCQPGLALSEPAGNTDPEPQQMVVSDPSQEIRMKWAIPATADALSQSTKTPPQPIHEVPLSDLSSPLSSLSSDTEDQFPTPEPSPRLAPPLTMPSNLGDTIVSSTPVESAASDRATAMTHLAATPTLGRMEGLPTSEAPSPLGMSQPIRRPGRKTGKRKRAWVRDSDDESERETPKGRPSTPMTASRELTLSCSKPPSGISVEQPPFANTEPTDEIDGTSSSDTGMATDVVDSGPNLSPENLTPLASPAGTHCPRRGQYAFRDRQKFKPFTRALSFIQACRKARLSSAPQFPTGINSNLSSPSSPVETSSQRVSRTLRRTTTVLTKTGTDRRVTSQARRQRPPALALKQPIGQPHSSTTIPANNQVAQALAAPLSAAWPCPLTTPSLQGDSSNQKLTPLLSAPLRSRPLLSPVTPRTQPVRPAKRRRAQGFHPSSRHSSRSSRLIRQRSASTELGDYSLNNSPTTESGFDHGSPQMMSTGLDPLANGLPISVTDATQLPALVAKSGAPPVVMFTGIGVSDRYVKAVRQIGGQITDKWQDCTHLVTDEIRRTVKFVCALAARRWVLSVRWLEVCLAHNALVDPSPFRLLNTPVLQAAPTVPTAGPADMVHAIEPTVASVFADCKIFVTAHVKRPSRSEAHEMIVAAQGQLFYKAPKIAEVKEILRKGSCRVVVVGCAADARLCRRLETLGCLLKTGEFLLSAIFDGRADYTKYVARGNAAGSAWLDGA